MERKVVDIIQAFQHCKFQECLRLSDQLLKKLQKGDSKKKNTITDQQLKNIHICRAGSYSGTGNIHIANAIISTQFKNAIVDQNLSFLFLQIVAMVLDPRLQAFVEQIEAKKEKKKININRFVLFAKKYSVLGRILLKQFMTSKKDQDNFGQVYLQYLNEYTKHRKISFARDRTFLQCKEANFKMVSMFLEKFSKNLQAKQDPKDKQEDGIRKKIKVAVTDLKLKIAIHEGNSEVARNLFVTKYDHIEERPFSYLRSIRELSTQQQDNRIFYNKQYLKIFTKNLNLDKYQPIYDYNDEFLNNLMKMIPQIKLQKPKVVDEEQVYAYRQSPQDQLQNYYDSLNWQYQRNIKNKEEYKIKDYYRICNKNVLLQLIKISHISKNIEEKQNFLLEYKKHFGKTLTFHGQILPFMKNTQFEKSFHQKMRQQPQGITKDEDKLIWLINVNKQYLKFENPKTMQEMLQIWKYYEQLYTVYVEKWQKLRHLEKGERYFSDDFILIGADYTRIFIQRQQISQIQRQQCCLGILKILEKVSTASPYNFDIKLRMMYFCDILNYYHKLISIYETMDIKAVQFETVGYWIIKPMINYDLWDSHQSLLVKIIRSYQQNNRQSAQYAYKAILHSSPNECEQFMSYNDNQNRSYNYILVLYILYLKHRSKGECQFYLRQILKRIKSDKTTFNCDFKVMDNIIEPNNEQVYAQFYGIYNNYKILQNQCKLKLIINDFIKKKQSQYSIKDINSEWKIQQMYDFKDYEYFQRTLQYQIGKPKHHQLQKEALTKLQHYNILLKIKINTIVLLNKMGFNGQQDKLQSILQCGQQVLKQIEELRVFLSQKISLRQQTKYVPFTRNQILDCLYPLQFAVQAYSGKSKKKIEGKAQKKQLCSKISDMLTNTVTTSIKLQDKLPVSKQFASETSIHQDEVLDRLTRMDVSEYRKLYKIK